MKGLNSPFRKLIGYKIFNDLLLMSVFAGLSACSSQINTTPQNLLTSDVAAKNSLPLISLADTIRESWFELRANSSKGARSSVRVSAKSCVDRRFVFGTTLQVLGQSFDVAFEEEADQLVVALIEDSETKLSGISLPADLKDQICAVSKSSNMEFIEIPDKQLRELQTAMASALQKITPDCREITYEGGTTTCKLESMMPQAALVKTEDFQKSMIRKWSRQPYILARRTGVVSTLARAATNMANDEAFVKFCKVLQFSLPEELPLVMTSRRWQSALCSAQSNNRREAAFFGLAKGTDELDMLRELYEGTSRVGVLSVKIPESSMPATQEALSKQPLRVIIAPDSAVSQKLVDQAKKYLGRSDRDLRPRRLVRQKRGTRGRKFYETVPAAATSVASNAQTTEMCWHPVFGETSGLLRTADGMKLTGKGFSLECGYTEERRVDPEAEVAALSKYLLHSLSSETEFVLDNGQSKLLRLPEGNYRYTVQMLPENPLDSEEVDEESVPKTTGELNWDSSRRHMIRSW
jgi:hypothetical protein